MKTKSLVNKKIPRFQFLDESQSVVLSLVIISATRAGMKLSYLQLFLVQLLK